MKIDLLGHATVGSNKLMDIGHSTAGFDSVKCIDR